MKMMKKLKLQKTINKYLYTIRLLFSGKNNLPSIDINVQDYIIYLIMSKKEVLSEFDILKLTITTSAQYNFRETLFYFIDYLNNFKNNQLYRKCCNDFMDLLIVHKTIFITNKNLNDFIFNKLKELNYVYSKLSHSEENSITLEKIKQSSQNIYGIDFDKICIRHNCSLYKSKLSHNFDLCHIHLIKHFTG